MEIQLQKFVVRNNYLHINIQKSFIPFFPSAPQVKVLPWSKKKKKEVVLQKEETKADNMNLEEAEKYQRTT